MSVASVHGPGLAAAFNFPRIQCIWQPFLGIVTLYGGDAAEARHRLDESRQLCLQRKERVRLTKIYTYLAEVDLWEGAIDQAGYWLAQSLTDGIQSARVTFDEVQQCWVAARLATAQHQYQRSATLFGLAEQAHSHIQHCINGPLRALADEALAIVQATLEPAVFAKAFAAGQQMTLEDAFATILTEC
ncbi:MAG: hypothetical protein U0175_31590 [Caldilineaceae bacterium]